VAEASRTGTDPKLRETIATLCASIAGVKDPGSRAELEAGRLTTELMGRLRAAAARLAQLERGAAELGAAGAPGAREKAP